MDVIPPEKQGALFFRVCVRKINILRSQKEGRKYKTQSQKKCDGAAIFFHHMRFTELVIRWEPSNSIVVSTTYRQ